MRDDILGVIGNTPLVRLNRVAQGVQASLYGKLEFLNPGGSVKDRIGIMMIEDAERRGQLRPGGTIVEATSGNTGVGLAIVAALRGYKSVFVMPDKMSDEKIRLLRAFGARVVITPTAVEPEDPRSYYSVARRIVQETPNAILANQYHNPANPEAHYRTTGPEIWRQTGGKIDVFVAGVGTGGTISGTGRYLKEQNPNIKVVGVDPMGSLLYDTFRLGRVPDEPFLKTYKTEGIGEDFVPGALDFGVIDDMVQVGDKETMLMTRRLVREEGIFCGGSSGTAVAGALHYAQSKNLPDGTLMVVILPDSGARYLSKVFNDDWMRENGFLESSWIENRASDVLRAKPIQGVITARRSDRMIEVIALMKQHDISQVPVVDEQDRLVGIVTEIDLLNHLLLGDHAHGADETIADIVDPDVTVVRPDSSLETLLGIFTTGNVAVVVENEAVVGILTKIDILDYLATRVQ
jgi:cystathionine beta-synthase